MRERVLITGASGFVGYHLITEALKKQPRSICGGAQDQQY